MKTTATTVTNNGSRNTRKLMNKKKNNKNNSRKSCVVKRTRVRSVFTAVMTINLDGEYERKGSGGRCIFAHSFDFGSNSKQFTKTFQLTT